MSNLPVLEQIDSWHHQHIFYNINSSSFTLNLFHLQPHTITSVSHQDLNLHNIAMAAIKTSANSAAVRFPCEYGRSGYNNKPNEDDDDSKCQGRSGYNK